MYFIYIMDSIPISHLAKALGIIQLISTKFDKAFKAQTSSPKKAKGSKS